MRYRELLDKNGLILFSLFGPATFFELNECLQELSGRALAIDSRNFIEKKTVEKVLEGLFRETEVKGAIYKENYSSLHQLLKQIKYTGVRGQGYSRRTLWTSKMVNELERIYQKRFKKITAIYEVFFCRGVK